jgi:hypothetical protein
LNLEINKEVILTEVFDLVGKAAGKVTDGIKNTDLNGIRDKILSNGGLLTGAALGGGSMLYSMLHDGENLGASIIGAGVIGTAGAGVGHVIHNQFKKKDNTPDFGNYPKY